VRVSEGRVEARASSKDLENILQAESVSCFSSAAWKAGEIAAIVQEVAARKESQTR
jgi:hypothetical protein